MSDAQFIRQQLILWLKNRDVKAGEMVQFGWFWFRVVVNELGIDLESLDFAAMGSWSCDLKNAGTIHRLQQDVLEREAIEPQDCHLCQYATITRSYLPGHPSVYMKRDGPQGSDSGWFVGVQDNDRDINDPDNLYRESLYELTIKDRRFAPYWLLPNPYAVLFDGNSVTFSVG